ncbi:MAG: cobalamin B12-binding domain-containing protein [Nitrospirae bacterium]|nr:cobalamin B12-binding domain-containing protein [Nitrospirota bacterium]
MRILLVKPHPQLLIAKRLQEGFLHLEPLELEIVAGGVPPEDEVVICDLGIEKKPMKAFHSQLHGFRPDIVGFTGYSSQSAMVKKLARIVKEHNPSAVNVVGGIHATIIPADYEVECIDIIVRGEGGTAFAEIISRFKKGMPLHFGGVSLSPRDPDFKAKTELPPPEFPSVHDIPRPRRDLVRRSRYFCIWTSTPENQLKTIFPQTASVRTSIGCAFKCSFCVVHHVMRGQYLQRRPADVADEIESLKEEFIYFVDDETFLNKGRMTEIAKLLIDRGIKKQYISWARSDTIVRNPELFQLWKEAGLSTVYVGLEAMKGERLDRYNKGTSEETNRTAVSILRDLGIVLHASFIVDPDFSVEDFSLLEEEVKKVCPAEVSFTVFSPPPGTKIWEKYKDDYICDPYLHYDCMHTILPTKLKMKKFYSHFARLTSVALKGNPARVHKVRIPFRDIMRVIYRSIRYTSGLKNIYRDY